MERTTEILLLFNLADAQLTNITLEKTAEFRQISRNIFIDVEYVKVMITISLNAISQAYS